MPSVSDKWPRGGKDDKEATDTSVTTCAAVFGKSAHRTCADAIVCHGMNRDEAALFEKMFVFVWYVPS